MKRRSVLGGLATAAVGLAGCLDGDDGETPGGDDGAGGRDTELAGTSFLVEGSQCDGDRDGASVTVGDGTVTVDGTILGDTDATTATLRGAAHTEGSEVLRVSVGTVTGEDPTTCATAFDYVAEVAFEGRPPAATAVYHDGVRVDAGDGAARVASFDVTGVEASPPRDEATVRRRDDGRIVVDGAIAGPDGCTTAAVDGVAYDAAEDRLAVDLVALQETAPPCSDGTVEVGYALEVAVPAGAPRRVDVAHDGEPVAAATWRDGATATNASGNVTDGG